MPRSRMSRAFFLAAVPAAGVAASLPAWAQSATLKVGATANDTYAQAYYAQDMGFFTKAGLNVEIQTFTNGAAVSQAVAAGALDIGISNPVQLGNAVSRGIPFVYVAGGGLYNTAAPTTVLCVAKDAPIKTAKDFAGQTIAVSALKDVTDLARSEYLEKNGVDPASVKTWANANHDQSGAILAKYSKISAETMHAMTRSSYATSLNPQFIDPMLQLAAKAKITDKLVTAASMMI